MEQKDKDLLLKDLSARLPYGIYVEMYSFSEKRSVKLKSIDISDDDYLIINNTWWLKDEYPKPYLRLMSSMTEEEVIEFNNIPSTKNYQIVNGDLPWDVANYKQIDWLLKNHFDFIGLIPKGLAIEVTEENNPYKD